MGMIDPHRTQLTNRVQPQDPFFHMLKATALDLIPRATAILLLFR